MKFKNYLKDLSIFGLLFLILPWTTVFVKSKILQRPILDYEVCRYRDTGIYPEDIFLNWATWGCYSYTRDDLFVDGRINPSICNVNYKDSTYSVPGIKINEQCVPFDRNTKEIYNAVAASFINKAILQRWEDCCQDADNCCRTVLMYDKHKDNYCGSLWDGWTCFNSIPSETVEERVCSPYSYTGKPPRCHHYSSKECYQNSTWNVQTDYSTCSITPRLILRTNWHMAMLSISIAIALPAVILLIFYRGLHLQKLRLIRYLMIAIVSRNFLVLLSKRIIVLNELTSTDVDTILSDNGWACRVLTVLVTLSTNYIFACMLLVGIYLHQLLTNVFQSRRCNGPNMKIYFYVVGGTPILATLTWSIVMAVHADELCWFVTDEYQFQWINDVPKLLMLLLSTFLLLHILIALWNSFQNNENESNNAALRTAKASLLCMPLFGVPFLFFLIRPNTDSCTAEQVYYFIYYAFESLQGIFVAILYCYADKQVQKYFKRKLEVLMEQPECPSFLSNTYKRINAKINRRTTVTTIADDRRTTGCSNAAFATDIVLQSKLPANNLSIVAEIEEAEDTNKNSENVRNVRSSENGEFKISESFI